MVARHLIHKNKEHHGRTPLKILAGTAMALFTLYLFLSIISYNQLDPSLNRATGDDAANWGGYFGAIVADLGLQSLGLASLLLVAIPLTWAVKIMQGSHITYMWLRFTLLLASLVTVSGLLALLDPPLSWSITSGFGGAIGAVQQEFFYKLYKNPLFVSANLFMSLVMVSLAFGMSWTEWRNVGHHL
ncbi:MAG: DNA translocase FtsK 4TM domain-containing protein, partial [Alphaproteobacteria bacterium]